MKERKPASFWICLGVFLALTVLLTTWTSLRLYPGLVNAPVPVGQERVYTLLVQQRVNLGEVCIYLAAVLLDIPFGMLALGTGSLAACLILGAYGSILPMLIGRLGAMLLTVLVGIRKQRDWHNTLLVVLLNAAWSVLVYFLSDLFAGVGYHAACVSFVSHLGESLVAGGFGLLFIRIKQSHMQELGDKRFVSVTEYPTEASGEKPVQN